MKSLLTLAAAFAVAAPVQAGPYLHHYKGADAALMCIEKQEFNERQLENYALFDLQQQRTNANTFAAVNKARAANGLASGAHAYPVMVETQREQQQLDWVQSTTTSWLLLRNGCRSVKNARNAAFQAQHHHAQPLIPTCKPNQGTTNEKLAIAAAAISCCIANAIPPGKRCLSGQPLLQQRR